MKFGQLILKLKSGTDTDSGDHISLFTSLRKQLKGRGTKHMNKEGMSTRV
jgi:hypothetical protein